MPAIFMALTDAQKLNQTRQTAASLQQAKDSTQGPRQGDVAAKLTAYDSGTGYYSWTEQAFDEDGVRYDKPQGLSGTPTYMPAMSMDGTEVVTPSNTPVWLRPTTVSSTLGQCWEILEYDATGGSGSFEYDQFLLNSDFTLTGSGSVSGEVTGWTSSLGSNTYIKFPSTGIWQLDITFYSRMVIDSTDLVEGTFWVEFSDVSLASTIIVPAKFGYTAQAILVNIYGQYLNGLALTTTTPILLDVLTANTKALTINANAFAAASASLTATISATAVPSGLLSWIRAVKVSS